MSPESSQIIASLQSLPSAMAAAIERGPMGQALAHLSSTQRGNSLEPTGPRIRQPTAFQATQRLLYATGAGGVANQIAQAKELYDAVAGFAGLFTRAPVKPPAPPSSPTAPATPTAPPVQNVHIVSPLPLPVRMVELPPISPVGPHPMAGSPGGPVGIHPLASGPAVPGGPRTPPALPQPRNVPLFPPTTGLPVAQGTPPPLPPGLPPPPTKPPTPPPASPILARPAGLPATSPLAPRPAKPLTPPPRSPFVPHVWTPAAAAPTIAGPAPAAPGRTQGAPPAPTANRLDEANRLSPVISPPNLNRSPGNIVVATPPSGKTIPPAGITAPPAPVKEKLVVERVFQSPAQPAQPVRLVEPPSRAAAAPQTVEPPVRRGRWQMATPTAPTLLSGRGDAKGMPEAPSAPRLIAPQVAPRDLRVPRAIVERPAAATVAAPVTARSGAAELAPAVFKRSPFADRPELPSVIDSPEMASLQEVVEKLGEASDKLSTAAGKLAQRTGEHPDRIDHSHEPAPQKTVGLGALDPRKTTEDAGRKESVLDEIAVQTMSAFLKGA